MGCVMFLRYLWYPVQPPPSILHEIQIEEKEEDIGQGSEKRGSRMRTWKGRRWWESLKKEVKMWEGAQDQGRRCRIKAVQSMKQCRGREKGERREGERGEGRRLGKNESEMKWVIRREGQRKEWKWWTYQKRYFLPGHHPLHCVNFLDPALCKPFSNKIDWNTYSQHRVRIFNIKTDASDEPQTWNILDDCIHVGTIYKSSLSHIKYIKHHKFFTINIPFLGGISHTTEPWLNPSLWWNCCKGRKTLRATGNCKICSQIITDGWIIFRCCPWHISDQ